MGKCARRAGFRDAYRQFIEAGWSALTGDADYGGQGLPSIVSAAVQEMWNAANMGFALCPLLSMGAVAALSFTGTDAQKALYLGKLIDGSWTGTMNLTESQAGSDLAAVRTRAVPEGDHYRLFGQKIYITYGEHDFTDNILHLVLARLPDAPDGVKGISLFLVPKFLVNPDGSLGARNDVHCVSLEHKLGIHASPTAVMAYGDREGAIGYLLGEANRGLEYMFVMMNEERFGVGMQGVAISERAYQQALEYARGRVQGTETGVRGGPRVPILRHPDVRRMLLIDEGGDRGDARAGLRRGRGNGCGAPPSGCGRACPCPGDGRSADPGGEGLRHRECARHHLDRHPGARRHGVHRGDGRRTIRPRCAHSDDL